MDLFCSFCGQTNNLINLGGLEFNDRHGRPTLAIEVVKKIQPEVKNSAKICEECFQAICNFHQQRESLEGNKTFDFPAKRVTKTMTDEQIDSPEEVDTVGCIRISSVQSLAQASEDGREQMQLAIEKVESLATKQENEEELLIEVDDSMKMKGSTKDKYKVLPSAPSSENNAALSSQSTVLPNTELRMLKNKLENISEPGDPCPFCTKLKFGKRNLINHMLFYHAENKELFKAFVSHHAKKSNRECFICMKKIHSHGALRAHLITHIVQEEVEDADYISMMVKVSLAAKSSKAANKKSKGKKVRKS